MDRLAEAVGLDPVEIRVRNGFTQGSAAPTGQVIDSAAPVAELVERLQAMPLPPAADGALDLRRLPGGVANTTHGEGVRRGVGYAVAYKNVAFSEGFDDYSTARVRLGIVGHEPVVTVHTAAAEVGQGLVTIEQQICRTELGVESVVVAPKDTQVGSAGSSSASRQTYVTGGAVKAACESVRRMVLARAAERLGTDEAALRLEDGAVVDDGGGGGHPGRPARHRRRRGHRGVAAPADVPHRPGDRAGRRPRAVRLRRAPRGRRRRRRARPGQGRRARLHPGRRQGPEPVRRRRPDPGRQHPGDGPGADGGDPDRRRAGSPTRRSPTT